MTNRHNHNSIKLYEDVPDVGGVVVVLKPEMLEFEFHVKEIGYSSSRTDSCIFFCFFVFCCCATWDSNKSRKRKSFVVTLEKKYWSRNIIRYFINKTSKETIKSEGLISFPFKENDNYLKKNPSEYGLLF